MDRMTVVLMILAGTLGAVGGADDWIGPYRALGHDPMVPTLEAGRGQTGQAASGVPVGLNGYSVRGRDPMVTMIVVTKAVAPGIVPQIPDPQTRSLADIMTAVEHAGRQRNFNAMLAAAEQGLYAVARLRDSSEADAIPTAAAEQYRTELVRYAAAAREGILQDEAMAAFMRIGLVLEGVMWDEAAPVAVIKGEARCAGDTFLGVRVIGIERNAVTVAFTYAGREFRYTLGL